MGGQVARGGLYPHVVAQDVHPAPGLRRPFHKGTAHVGCGHIGVDVAYAVARGGDFSARFVVDIGAQDLRPLIGKCTDDAPTDPLGAAGYDDHLSFEFT